MKVGIYHVFEANRMALIKEFGNSDDFEFETIDYWEKVETTYSELIVIFSPGFLPNQVSVDQFKAMLKRIKKTLIIVAYNIDIWRMDRKKTFYLEQSDNKETIDSVRVILALEKMGYHIKLEKITPMNSS